VPVVFDGCEIVTCSCLAFVIINRVKFPRQINEILTVVEIIAVYTVIFVFFDYELMLLLFVNSAVI